MEFRIGFQLNFFAKGATPAPDPNDPTWSVVSGGKVKASYRIFSDGSVEILTEGGKGHLIQPSLGLSKLDTNLIFQFDKSHASIAEMFSGLKSFDFRHYILMEPKEYAESCGKSTTLLVAGIREQSDASFQIVYRAMDMTVTNDGEPVPEELLTIHNETYGEHRPYEYMTTKEAVSEISRLHINLSLLEEMTLTMDFSEKRRGKFYLKEGTDEAVELTYSKAQQFIRDYPLNIRAGVGLFRFISDFANKDNLLAAVSLLRKYPMLLNVYKTYGQDAYSFLHQMGMTPKNIPDSFKERGSLKKALGISSSLLNILGDAAKATGGEEVFFAYLLSLKDRINPQVVESICKEFVKVYKALKEEDNLRAAKFADCVSSIKNIICYYGGTSGKDYDFVRLFRYITHEVMVYQGIENPRDAVMLLQDYYNNTAAMGIKITDWFPKSLKLAHDMAARNYKIQINENKQAMFGNAVSAKDYQDLTYADKEWLVLAPKASNDLVVEGQKQSHCVGTYIDYVVYGSHYILFMRRTDDPDTPVITLDVDPKERSLVQYRGFANRSPDEDEMKFIKKWAKKKGLKVV